MATSKPLDTDVYRKRLLDKEQELLTIAKRATVSARERPEPGAVDIADESVVSERKESLFLQVDRARRLLKEVQDALQRIKDGSYGVCDDCGNEIEEKRLNAVPWAKYCLKDQSKHDQAATSSRTL